MNRRSFLSGLSALVGGILLNEAVPLGRVWSFPKVIKSLNCASTPGACVLDCITCVTPEALYADGRLFYSGQKVSVFSASSNVHRGTLTVERVIVNGLYTDFIPIGTMPGDLILLTDAELGELHG